MADLRLATAISSGAVGWWRLRGAETVHYSEQPNPQNIFSEKETADIRKPSRFT